MKSLEQMLPLRSQSVCGTVTRDS